MPPLTLLGDEFRVGDHLVGGRKAELGTCVGTSEGAGFGDGDKALGMCEGVDREVVNRLMGGGHSAGEGSGGEHALNGFREKGFNWFALRNSE